MSASWRLVSPRALSSLLLRRVCRVVFRACGEPPPEALALGRVVGGWRLRRRSTPFSLGFLGRLLLRDRRSVVPVFVGLSLAFMAARRDVSVRPQLLRAACVLLQPQNPLTGWTALFFGAPWLLHGVSLNRAEVVMAVSRPGGLRDWALDRRGALGRLCGAPRCLR